MHFTSPFSFQVLWTLSLFPLFVLRSTIHDIIYLSICRNCYVATSESSLMIGSHDEAQEKSCYPLERFSEHICIVDYIQWSWYVSLDCSFDKQIYELLCRMLWLNPSDIRKISEVLWYLDLCYHEFIYGYICSTCVEASCASMLILPTFNVFWRIHVKYQTHVTPVRHGYVKAHEGSL